MTATPPVLLKYQREFVSCRDPVRVWEKSRRIGASWSLAADYALDAARTDGPDCWYVGYNYDMAREFIDDVGMWSRVFNIAASEVGEVVLDDEHGSILMFEVKFSSGHRVQALSSRPTNLRGKGGRAGIDEAAFHDDLPGLLKAALAFLMWGGRVDILSSHNGVESEFAKLIERVRSGLQKATLFRTTIDDALADGLYNRICLVRGIVSTPEGKTKWRDELMGYYGDFAEEELLCVPARSGGTYLPAGLVEECMFTAPVVQLDRPEAFTWKPDAVREADVKEWCDATLGPLLAALPNDREHYLGQDFGRTSDLTAIAPVTVERDLSRRYPFVAELWNIPFDQQRDVSFYIADRLPNFRGGAIDQGGNGQYLAEKMAQRYGDGRINRVSFSEKTYLEILPPLKAAMQSHLVWLPRDAGVKSDLQAFRVINGLPKLPPARIAGDKKGKTRHGDTGIAIALAHHASKQDGWLEQFKQITMGAR